MKVDIWSDVVCPFCYIGKRRLEEALESFAHRDEVEVVWHSFQLDPGAPAIAEGRTVDKLAAKYGMTLEQAVAAQESLAANAATVGLEFNWQETKSGNTFDAHRLIHFAATQGRADAMKERLLRAFFTEGEQIGDRDVLVRLAGEAGVDEQQAREVLESGAHADEVQADIAQAQAYGIRGVPFFVIDDKYGISGAQPTELFSQALDQAWTEAHPLQMVTTNGADDAACEGDSCAI
jgi:predicted DsbA family dithiol-disulfide isomerase